LYDRKDGAPGGEHVVDLREVVDVRAPESSPVEEHDSTG
jgi:hypothetical protein